MGDRLEIDALLKKSEVARLVEEMTGRRGRSLLFGENVKPVSADHIARLTAQGCESSNWSQVFVGEGFDPRAISRSRFEGTCVLGRFTSSVQLAPGVKHPSGIYNSLLIDCEVGDGVLVRDVGLLANCVVNEEAVISNVGELTASSHPTFGNGLELALGIETGERAVRAFAELDLDLASALVKEPPGSELRKEYEELVERFLGLIALLRKGYVGRRATIRTTPRLRDLFVGEGAEIVGATAVENSTILSSAEEPSRITDGALVKDSIIQWGCEVTSGAIVEKSVLTEHSHVERHGKVTHSLLGPNTGVGEGEVTSALVGPFVGFHHQSLLIAAVWPEGKGNIGYGANVGSNHTSKAPDQEIWAGEGMFFGLGVNIKFPANFSRAPYTIIATGVTTLPQKVEFPFSLINTPARVFAGVSPAFNEIIPGWVLSDNPYALARNEAKFRDRNKARRTKLSFEVLRPQTVDLIKEARRRLADAPAKEPLAPGEPVLYFERDIAGLGKNYLLDENRKKAIEAYSFYLRFYGLRGLYRRLVELEEAGGGQIESVLAEEAATLRWAHEREVLVEELPDRRVSDLLDLWVEHFETYVKSVEQSKTRDDRRGAKTIPDYEAMHHHASEDKLVRRLSAELEEIKQRVAGWLKR